MIRAVEARFVRRPGIGRNRSFLPAKYRISGVNTNDNTNRELRYIYTRVRYSGRLRTYTL